MMELTWTMLFLFYTWKKKIIENLYIHYYIHNNIVLVNSIHFKPCLFLSIKIFFFITLVYFVVLSFIIIIHVTS